MNPLRQLVLFTFDYELFLGPNSGTPNHCLLKPSEALLHSLQEFGVPAIFFVDTLYLHRLQEISTQFPQAADDFYKISEQLADVLRDGHELFYHLHPHWMQATYDEKSNTWSRQPHGPFAFSNFSPEEQNGFWHHSKKVMTRLYDLAGKPFSADGYRAGGLYLQPFSLIENYFRSYGIRFEFSVAPGFQSRTSTCGFNYSGAPEKPYRFTLDELQPQAGGLYCGFPLSVFPIKGWNKWKNGLWYRLHHRQPGHRPWGDGSPSGNTIVHARGKSPYSHFEIPSVEMLNPVKLEIYKRLMKSRSYVHFLSHPKLAGPVQIACFRDLLAHCVKQPAASFRFREYAENPSAFSF